MYNKCSESSYNYIYIIIALYLLQLLHYKKSLMYATCCVCIQLFGKGKSIKDFMNHSFQHLSVSHDIFRSDLFQVMTYMIPDWEKAMVYHPRVECGYL